MKGKLQNLGDVPRPRPQWGAGSTWHVLILCLALVSFGVGRQWSKGKHDSGGNSRPSSGGIPPEKQVDNVVTPVPVVSQEEEPQVREESDAEAATPLAPREVETLNRLELQPPTPLPPSEPTPLARELVVNLTQVDFSQPLTVEKAAHWKGSLLQLIQQGDAAVPAIQEFLALNRDWDLGVANPLGYPSLRVALLEALEQVNNPASRSLLLQTLQTTAVPSEIAHVARALERQAPGQYLQEIRAAVRETLAQAAAGQMSGWDMGPLFQVLQSQGNASAVPDLEQNASKWNYYSALALANLPSGTGIPALVRLAQEPSGGTRAAALEVLAQVAVQYPLAGATLIEMARAGQLSEKNWIAAAAALEGIQYAIRDNGLENPPPPSVGAGVKNYYLARGNQHFYSTPAWGGMSNEQIQQRLLMIDQLLAANPSAAVAQALQAARSSLEARGQHASVN